MIWVVILVPLILLGYNIAFKRGMEGYLPHDSFADISLAALTASGVHIFRQVFRDGISGPIGVWALFIVFLQFAIWFGGLFWAKSIRDRQINVYRGFELYVSYGFGAGWFVFSNGLILIRFYPS